MCSVFSVTFSSQPQQENVGTAHVVELRWRIAAIHGRQKNEFLLLQMWAVL